MTERMSSTSFYQSKIKQCSTNIKEITHLYKGVSRLSKTEDKNVISQTKKMCPMYKLIR